MKGTYLLTELEAEELDRRVAEYRVDQEPGEPWRVVLGEIEIEGRSLLAQRRDGLQAAGAMGGEEGS
jgi:hypothetical protein